MIPPERPSELPEEFADSIRLERFHRFAIEGTGDAVAVYFGLRAEDGTLHRFKTDLDLIASLAAEFHGLSHVAQAMAKAQGLNVPVITFQTNIMAFAHSSGHGNEGNLSLFIGLPNGQSFLTHIGPMLASQVLTNLKDALDSLPTPPSAFPSTLAPFTPTTPGTPRSGGLTRTHFGRNILSIFLKHSAC